MGHAVEPESVIEVEAPGPQRSGALVTREDVGPFSIGAARTRTPSGGVSAACPSSCASVHGGGVRCAS